MTTPRAHVLPASLRSQSGLRVTKGHGTFNDFVLVDDPEGELALDAQHVAGLADRRGGLGGDGVIRVVRTRAAGIDAPADAPEWFMDYRNADGSIAEMCGNGVRVFAAYLDRAGRAPEGIFPIWTRSGVRTVEILERPGAGGAGAWQVRVGMGPARIGATPRTLELAGHQLTTTDVDMGNPHAVAILPAEIDLDGIDLEHRPELAPFPETGVNIEMVSLRGPRHAALRVHERGVGETLSCGTGTVAAAVVAARSVGEEGGAPWRMDVPGGTLTVGWTEDGQTTLSGPAELIADVTLLA